MARPLCPAGPPGPVPASLRLWAAIGAGWTLYAAVTAALFQLTAPEPEGRLRWAVPLMLAVGGFWTLATPPVARLTRWLAPERVGWVRSAAGHLVAGLALGVGSAAVRWLVFRALREDPPSLTRIAAWLLDYHLAMYALVVVVARAAESHRAFVERSRRALALEAQVARAQLDFLQRQLQPHFLFNTLNVAAELTREAPRAAARMLRQLARLLAAATERLTESEVPLAEELRLLDAYAEVQRTRFGKALDVAYRVPPELGAARVPTLVLQPLLENAIRHGLSSGRGRVEVAGARRGDRLVLTIEDSGAGATAADPELDGGGRGGGIGLRNTRDRLAVLHGDAFALDLRRAAGGGTVAVLELPYTTGAARRPERSEGPPMESITPEVLRSAEDDREDDAVVALARAANAGTAPAPTGAAEPHVDAPRVRATRILAFWLAVALLWCVQGMLMRAVADGPVLPALDDVVGNFVAAGTWAAMTPVVLWLARAVRVTRDRWAAPLAAHAVLCAAVATAQIALADTLLGVPALPRAPILVNPLTQSALAYLSIVAWSHAHDFARRFRERAVAAERLAADLEQTELRARALELHPAFIVAVLQRGAAIVEEEPERVEEALERLADLLRLILDEAHVERGGGTAPTVREELALLEESLDVLALVAGRPIALDEEQLPAEALEARVTAGTLRRVVDLALPRLGQRGEAAPPRLVVEVTAEGTEGVPAVGTEIGSRAWRVTARVVPRPGDPAALPAAAHVA